jgi:predicted KAP-like P-loop ATPase
MYIYFDSSQTAKSDDKTDKSLNFADIKDNILVLEDENRLVKSQGLSPSKTPSKEQLHRKNFVEGGVKI